jgi:hypothetical protein
MPTYTFTGVTGVGLITFPAFLTPIGVYYDVTTLGTAEGVDQVPPVRYLHLGWIALVDTDPDVGAGIVGDYLHEPLFLWYQKGWIERKLKLDASTGATGFVHHLEPGNVIDFYWY